MWSHALRTHAMNDSDADEDVCGDEWILDCDWNSKGKF